MNKRQICLALSVFVLSTASALTGALAATDVGNGAPLDVLANRVGNGFVDFALQCGFHWTAECDAAAGSDPADGRKLIMPQGEGLPLPWPFPWKALMPPVEM